MRVRVLSDLHLEFGAIDLPEVPADVVVLAGDIHTGTQGLEWARVTFPRLPIVYVAGNHEYYGHAIPALQTTLRAHAAALDITLLENTSVELAGVTFLGCTLWTDFALFGDARLAGQHAALVMNDYRRIRISPIYRRLQPADTIRWHRRSFQWLSQALAQNRGPVVVVTHHVPSTRSIAPQYVDDLLTAAFASSCDTLVAASQAALWIHGHTHTAFDYMLGKTRVCCNPRGYPGESSGFNPALVVELPRS
jgi:predicted phosphodiesterase